MLEFIFFNARMLNPASYKSPSHFPQLQSLERAYEDMSLAGKREEERMKRTDPMKAQQAERLGMGLGVRR